MLNLQILRNHSFLVEPGYGGVVHPRVAHVRPVYDYDYYDRGVSVDTLLPKCSYINTDFEGNDVGDGRGLTAGSPYACKQSCIDQDGCEFWTFRRGWARDCYLKRGDGNRILSQLSRGITQPHLFCLLQATVLQIMSDEDRDSSPGPEATIVSVLKMVAMRSVPLGGVVVKLSHGTIDPAVLDSITMTTILMT